MKKEEGFPGQLSFVLPEKVVNLIRQNRLINDLYFTDIGYYPQARYHFRFRERGSAQYILIYCLDGEGVIHVKETDYPIHADQYFIIPAGVGHAYHSSSKQPWSIYWIHFTGEKAMLYHRLSGACFDIKRERNSRIHDRLNLFAEIFRNLERGYSQETLEYVNLCLRYLLASFSHVQQFREVKLSDEDDVVAQTINYMLENLDRKLKLEQIASVVALSASHYSRTFQNRTGYSPIEYFIQLKIQRACQLLDKRSLSIAEVAYQLGYDDQFYFSRQFRKVMNVTPRAYRKR
ncbi:AraC family transcriptional regulator [Sunxiuqinia rutila]|uniref:AraC family transcriptional regulator n=1 Tax=Sunxiuqinia rutila TaxID=1397841 RepID=UPI003D35BE7B